MGTYYGLRTCKNPDCDEVFEPYRSWQEFHSPSCRNAFYEKHVRHPLARATMTDNSVGDKNGKPKKFP